MSLTQYAVDGAVAVIRLDRPPVNALSDEFAVQIRLALTRAAADDGVRAVVVHGDPHFAAGADIKAFSIAHADHSARRPVDIDPAAELVAAIRVMETVPKPVIAAIRGYALGGGLELALGADFRVAGEGATVGQPEILLGLIPGAGGTQRLTRLVGLQAARDLTYTGRHVAAGEALALGIVDRVVPDADVLAGALEWAHRLATGPTRAIAAAKRSINEGWGRPVEDALAIEREAFTGIFFTDDAKEGVDAFVHKRPPEFRGR